MMNPIAAFRGMFADLLRLPTEELVLRLTLLTLLLHGSSETWLDVALQVLCGMMLVSRNHFASPGLWIAVSSFIWIINATDWLWIDNHKFLMSYWVLACTVAVLSKAPMQVLRWNGKVLVGLCFGFATLWKLLAGQYWNGDFMVYTLLVDGRMEFIANSLAGIPKADLAQSRLLEDTIGLLPNEQLQTSLPITERLRFVALGMSWWTLLIEAATAVLFLVKSPISNRWRDLVLLAFVASTYVFVPVLGFGYILTIMGLASCPPERTMIRTVYLAVLVILQLGRLPWERLLS
tara:strand:+ start:43 stop:915 length:873 start_codon:yes stop_codon:yes gene_type:complete